MTSTPTLFADRCTRAADLIDDGSDWLRAIEETFPTTTEIRALVTSVVHAEARNFDFPENDEAAAALRELARNAR